MLATAVFLRFWQLGDWPPGLYRDEAYNGLDALRVLDGEHALFFTANNGREPAYIYLTAAAIALLGRTALAVRLGAAVVGSLTTLVVYMLGREWFGQRVGLLAASLWAITLWPVHLSRIGLRAILLAPLLGLTFWLGTRAYRCATVGCGWQPDWCMAQPFTPTWRCALRRFCWWGLWCFWVPGVSAAFRLLLTAYRLLILSLRPGHGRFPAAAGAFGGATARDFAGAHRTGFYVEYGRKRRRFVGYAAAADGGGAGHVHLARRYYFTPQSGGPARI